MNKKPAEPGDMRMPAAEFDEIMRKAIGSPAPPPMPKSGKLSPGDKSSDRKPEQSGS